MIDKKAQESEDWESRIPTDEVAPQIDEAKKSKSKNSTKPTKKANSTTKPRYTKKAESKDTPPLPTKKTRSTKKAESKDTPPVPKIAGEVDEAELDM